MREKPERSPWIGRGLVAHICNPAPRGLRWEERQYKASLGYIMRRHGDGERGTEREPHVPYILYQNFQPALCGANSSKVAETEITILRRRLFPTKGENVYGMSLVKFNIETNRSLFFRLMKESKMPLDYFNVIRQCMVT